MQFKRHCRRRVQGLESSFEPLRTTVTQLERDAVSTTHAVKQLDTLVQNKLAGFEQSLNHAISSKVGELEVKLGRHQEEVVRNTCTSKSVCVRALPHLGLHL